MADSTGSTPNGLFKVFTKWRRRQWDCLAIAEYQKKNRKWVAFLLPPSEEEFVWFVCFSFNLPLQLRNTRSRFLRFWQPFNRLVEITNSCCLGNNAETKVLSCQILCISMLFHVFSQSESKFLLSSMIKHYCSSTGEHFNLVPNRREFFSDENTCDSERLQLLPTNYESAAGVAGGGGSSDEGAGSVKWGGQLDEHVLCSSNAHVTSLERCYVTIRPRGECSVDQHIVSSLKL